MRLAGSARPEAFSAARTRSRDSATALSPRPTSVKTDIAVSDLHLHVDRPGLDALEGHCRNSHNHGTPSRQSRAPLPRGSVALIKS